MSRRAHRQSFGDPAFDADPAEHPRPDDAAEHADHDYRHGRQGRNPAELADTDSAIAVVTDFGSSEATTAGSAPHPTGDQRDADDPHGAADQDRHDDRNHVPRML